MAGPDATRILLARSDVDFAEPNWIVRHDSRSNDPYYVNGVLWGMYGDHTSPANEFGSQAGELWGRGFTGSSRVHVAVIDEGSMSAILVPEVPAVHVVDVTIAVVIDAVRGVEGIRPDVLRQIRTTPCTTVHPAT